MYVAHVAWGLTMTEVGTLFGRDRTTVHHAVRLVEDLRDDQQMDRMIDGIEREASPPEPVVSVQCACLRFEHFTRRPQKMPARWRCLCGAQNQADDARLMALPERG